VCKNFWQKKTVKNKEPIKKLRNFEAQTLQKIRNFSLNPTTKVPYKNVYLI